MSPPLGIIEGYYGTPWSWAERAGTIAFLAPHGYEFYFFAPKADPFLRKRWKEMHPPEEAQHLRDLSAHCRKHGVRFGVGLSPYEIYRDFGVEAKDALAHKLAALDAIGLDDLAVLFDDMRGDLPDLAQMQADIIHWVADHTSTRRLTVCPSYYSDDPLLDRFFGARPDRYMEDFGQFVDKSVNVFWTGEEVCSREFSPGHLERVAGQLRRKPILWDNYPVNDGKRMSQFLHLRAFAGRPGAIGAHISAHAVNPALQPTLSRIPALTLAESYETGEAYEYGRAFERAAAAVAGVELAAMLRDDLLLLQDIGLDNLGKSAARLRECYGANDHPCAREVIAWLDGAYRFRSEMPEA